MSVKIRLKKMGRTKRPFYRLVAIDSKKRRDGLEVERLGWYDPLPNNMDCQIKEDRVLFWLDEGAQPSDTVKGIFRRQGLSYKWYLMGQGIKGLELDKLLEEWQERESSRVTSKHGKKVKKKELAAKKAAEEAPAEEAPAKEAPAKEAQAPVEAAAEEAPGEQAAAATVWTCRTATVTAGTVHPWTLMKTAPLAAATPSVQVLREATPSVSAVAPPLN